MRLPVLLALLAAPAISTPAISTPVLAAQHCTCIYGYVTAGGAHCTAWDCHEVEMSAPRPKDVLKESDCPQTRTLVRTEKGFRLACGEGPGLKAWFPPNQGGFCAGLLCSDGSSMHDTGTACACAQSK